MLGDSDTTSSDGKQSTDARDGDISPREELQYAMGPPDNDFEYTERRGGEDADYDRDKEESRERSTQLDRDTAAVEAGNQAQTSRGSSEQGSSGSEFRKFVRFPPDDVTTSSGTITEKLSPVTPSSADNRHFMDLVRAAVIDMVKPDALREGVLGSSSAPPPTPASGGLKVPSPDAFEPIKANSVPASTRPTRAPTPGTELAKKVGRLLLSHPGSNVLTTGSQSPTAGIALSEDGPIGSRTRSNTVIGPEGPEPQDATPGPAGTTALAGPSKQAVGKRKRGLNDDIGKGKGRQSSADRQRATSEHMDPNQEAQDFADAENEAAEQPAGKRKRGESSSQKKSSSRAGKRERSSSDSDDAAEGSGKRSKKGKK